MKDYEGTVFHIIHCEGAIDSFYEALKRVQKHKQESLKAQMLSLIERLGNGHKLSGDSFPTEGDLPKGGSFRAIKKLPVRAYVWRSKKHSNTYYISHYIYKDYPKLKPKDCEKVCNNWRLIEEN